LAVRVFSCAAIFCFYQKITESWGEDTGEGEFAASISQKAGIAEKSGKKSNKKPSNRVENKRIIFMLAGANL